MHHINLCKQGESDKGVFQNVHDAFLKQIIFSFFYIVLVLIQRQLSDGARTHTLTHTHSHTLQNAKCGESISAFKDEKINGYRCKGKQYCTFDMYDLTFAYFRRSWQRAPPTHSQTPPTSSTVFYLHVCTMISVINSCSVLSFLLNIILCVNVLIEYVLQTLLVKCSLILYCVNLCHPCFYGNSSASLSLGMCNYNGMYTRTSVWCVSTNILVLVAWLQHAWIKWESLLWTVHSKYSTRDLVPGCLKHLLDFSSSIFNSVAIDIH